MSACVYISASEHVIVEQTCKSILLCSFVGTLCACKYVILVFINGGPSRMAAEKYVPFPRLSFVLADTRAFLPLALCVHGQRFH